MRGRYQLDLDWRLLAKQKKFLLELIDADQKVPSGLTSFGPYASGDHPVEGIVEMLDAIQDQAAEMGEPVVWLTEYGEGTDVTD